MQKQVLSKEEEKIQDKFNKISIFISKFLFRDNLDSLKKAGFQDSFIQDPTIGDVITREDHQRFLFLLFKNKKMSVQELEKIVLDMAVVPVESVISYELVNDYSMVVLEFPEKFISDYDNVVHGKYSKLSEEYKKGFPDTRDVFNSEKKRIGAEYTIYHHVFNKTNWLKEFWKEKLNLAEIDDNLELWTKPYEEDLIFNVKTII